LPGIYVHVPFCSAICNYCNFNRGLYDEGLKARFVAALLQEMAPGAFSVSTPVSADTLYFGGGTPSLLSSADVEAIIGEARRSRALTDAAEITLEANPESVSQESLEHFRRSGVNRLSFGVQSFRDGELKRLGRLHSAERAVDAIRLARAAGFDNISLDLMMWLPGQDVRQWLGSVEDAIRVGPEHMSLYILEVYPHLPLKQEIKRHGWQQASEDMAAEMYESAMAMLESAGYEQYEISNVCRPGRLSRHNIILDRRRLAGIRSRRTLHVAGDTVAHHRINRRLHSENQRRPAGDRRPSHIVERRAPWRCAVYRTSHEGWHRPRNPVEALRRRCLAQVWRTPRAVSRRGPPAETGRTSLAEPERDAPGQRSHVGVRLDLSLRCVPAKY
jgi:putative oxygen-independent coproporphyrinogen III oxidase